MLPDQPLSGVTGIVYRDIGRGVRAELVRSGQTRVLALDPGDWQELTTQARSAGIPMRADWRAFRYLEWMCAAALALVFVLSSAPAGWLH